MSRTLRFNVFVLLLALSACTTRVEPLHVPDAKDVSSIEGTISNSYDLSTKTYRDSVTIKDPAHIGRVVDFVTKLNSEMVVPFGTFPTPTHAIELSDNTGINLVVFIGLDWVGGRNNVEGVGAQNRLRNITEAQRAELLRLVGLKDYRF